MKFDNPYHNHNNGIRKYKEFAKECAGLKCSNKPTALLKVKYINKTGSFCQKCIQRIYLQLELAEEIPKGEILNA